MIDPSNWSTDPSEWFLITRHTRANSSACPHVSKNNYNHHLWQSFQLNGEGRRKVGPREPLTVWLLLSKLLVRHQVATCGRPAGQLECGAGFYPGSTLAVGFARNYFIESFCLLKRFNWSTVPTLEKVIFFYAIFVFCAFSWIYFWVSGYFVKTSSCNWPTRWMDGWMAGWVPLRYIRLEQLSMERNIKRLLISINRSCQF